MDPRSAALAVAVWDPKLHTASSAPAQTSSDRELLCGSSLLSLGPEGK